MVIGIINYKIQYYWYNQLNKISAGIRYSIVIEVYRKVDIVLSDFVAFALT